MKRYALTSAVAAAVTLMGASIASADIVVGSSGDAWQSFPVTINNYSDANRPYWDNKSRDVAVPATGGPENIGNYLVGPFNSSVTGPLTSPGITPTWWGGVGASTANADMNMQFTRGSSTGPITATLLVESTDDASTNIVGWYDADNPSDKTVLWNGAASPTSNATVTFTPTTDWGFYMIGKQGTYYMDAALSTADTTSQHFALFQSNAAAGSEAYYVGIEDLNNGSAVPEGNGDFNDFIFSFQSTGGGGTPPTPEPASLGILGAGALGLLMRRRK